MFGRKEEDETEDYIDILALRPLESQNQVVQVRDQIDYCKSLEKNIQNAEKDEFDELCKLMRYKKKQSQLNCSSYTMDQGCDQHNQITQCLQSIIFQDGIPDANSPIGSQFLFVYSQGYNDILSRYQDSQPTSFSRQVQNNYFYGTDDQKNAIFEMIKQQYQQFAVDKYNHYILEKILDIGKGIIYEFAFLFLLKDYFSIRNGQQRIFMTIEIIFKWTNLDQKYYRNVQKYKIEIKYVQVSKKENLEMYKNFVRHVVSNRQKLKQQCMDRIGTQLIQRCLDVFEDDDLYQILKALEQYVMNFDRHKRKRKRCHMQQSIWMSHSQQDYRHLFKETQLTKCLNGIGGGRIDLVQLNYIIEEIIKMASYLSRKQYANYIIQQLLERGSEIHKNLLLYRYLKKDFVSMSMDKYGSNIGEKAIQYGGEQWRQQIWDQEIAIQDFIFRKLANDQYANYVMQRMYEYSGPIIKSEFMSLINYLFQSNRLNTHGFIVLKYVEKSISKVKPPIKPQLEI